MSARWTLADVRALKVRHRLAGEEIAEAADPRPLASPRAKYRNAKCVIDGKPLDSKKEGEHYLHLRMRERLKEISSLEMQPVFELFYVCPRRGRIHIGMFTPDFRYFERTVDGRDVVRVVDVKSVATKTEAYRLRKRLFEAIYDIELIEV